MPEPSTACIPYTPPGTHCYPKAFYSIREAAQLLHLSPQTVRAMVRQGQLRALSIQSYKRINYRIPVAELIRAITPL